MIIKEFYRVRNDGSFLYRTYSTIGLPIQKTGTNEVYKEEAIDLEWQNFIYVEITEKKYEEILKRQKEILE